MSKDKKRPNGSGSIFQRASGTWVAKIQIGTKPDGRPIIKSFTAQTKMAVTAKLQAFKASFRPAQIDYLNMSVSDALEDYLFTYKKGNIKDSSFDRLQSIWKCHIKASNFGTFDVLNVKLHDVQVFINEKRNAGYSLSTIKKIKELLSQFYEQLVSELALQTNPVKNAKLPKVTTLPQKNIEIYTSQEIAALKSAITNSYRNDCKRYRIAPIFIFMLNTGLRVGEVLALTWNDIDLGNKTVSVNKSLSVFKIWDTDNNTYIGRKAEITLPKTVTSIRTIPLNDEAIAALDEIKRRYITESISSPYVVSTKTGNPVSERNIAKTLDRVAKVAGIESKGLHALRHTFASVAAENNMPTEFLAKIMGHTSTIVTQKHYIHLTAGAQVNGANIMYNLNI